MSKPARYVALSQLSFFIGLGICFIILPRFLLERNEGGVSNYGVHWQTIVPYTLAFALCGIFLARAALLLPRAKVFKRLRLALLLVAGSLFLVLGSTYPYQTNDAFRRIHIFFGIELFCLEVALAFWLVLTFCKDKQGMVLLAGQVIGFLLAGLTLFGVLHLLFVAQIMASLSFGLLLVRGVQTALASGR